MKHVLPLFILTLLFSCSSERDSEKEEDEISQEKEEAVANFVVAGHAYGSATHFTETVYPGFMTAFKTAQQNVKIDGLILTGDVVAHPRPTQWDSTKKQLDSLGVPWYIAPGNHDLTAHFTTKIQPSPYLSFKDHNKLFLVLNTTHVGWSVDSTQKQFIHKALKSASDCSSIFVFSHQLWWQKSGAPESMDLDSVRTNSYALFDGETSFWKDAWPLFDTVKKPVYFFAGDLGCDPVIRGYYEDHHENYHFYGSGMGGSLEDNFLMIEIYEPDSVNIRRIDF